MTKKTRRSRRNPILTPEQFQERERTIMEFCRMAMETHEFRQGRSDLTRMFPPDHDYWKLNYQLRRRIKRRII